MSHRSCNENITQKGAIFFRKLIMDWRRDWRTITIHGKTETFIISIIKESNGTFVFNLSDFKILWREQIDTEEIIRRAKVSQY